MKSPLVKIINGLFLRTCHRGRSSKSYKENPRNRNQIFRIQLRLLGLPPYCESDIAKKHVDLSPTMHTYPQFVRRRPLENEIRQVWGPGTELVTFGIRISGKRKTWWRRGMWLTRPYQSKEICQWRRKAVGQGSDSLDKPKHQLRERLLVIRAAAKAVGGNILFKLSQISGSKDVKALKYSDTSANTTYEYDLIGDFNWLGNICISKIKGASKLVKDFTENGITYHVEVVHWVLKYIFFIPLEDDIFWLIPNRFALKISST